MRNEWKRAILGLILLASPVVGAGWSDPASPLRRPIEITQDAKQVDGSETVVAEFFAPGLARPDGSDLHVSADDGRPVPMRLLRQSPDDRLMVVFNPLRGKTKFFAYWGSPEPPRRERVDPKINAGLLVECKRLGSGQFDTTQQLAQLWDRSGDVVCSTIIDRPYLGYQPCRFEGATITKITGSLYAPGDGDHTLALSADDAAGLRLDGADVIFARNAVGDIRFNKTIALKRGAHPMELYHVDVGGTWLVAMAWQRPDTPRAEPVAADSFGKPLWGRAGPLEQKNATLTADIELNWLGEQIAAERSSYRVRLTAVLPEKAADARVKWDFGDGQSATGESVVHVYLSPGLYRIGVEMQVGGKSDQRAFSLNIRRDPIHPVDPALDQQAIQADAIATYDFAKLAEPQQAMALRILARADRVSPMLKALRALTERGNYAERQWTTDAINEAADRAVGSKRAAELADVLANIPANSDLQPRVAVMLADTLLWRTGDFKRAAEKLGAMIKSDQPNLRVLRMQALLLDGQADAARKILESLPSEPDAGRRMALSGAMARSVEYFIDEKDFDTASERWEQWQRQFPETFFEGYSALLKVRMLEPETESPAVAAKVAEAFALAVPSSPYAPQLLDRAARILAKSDKPRSDAIRKLLKEKYPEDPLSQ